MRQITESVYLHQDTCNVYVIKSGTEAVLVDFGDGSVLQHLAAIGIQKVTDVLMTHHHRDQAQGLPLAVQAGARIWVPHQEQDLFHSVNEHWQAREIFNSYMNRQDRFSLLESVPVAGTLKDYESRWFGAHGFQVVPTPGHTTGSITLMAVIDAQYLAFTGDLVYAPGQVWSLAATQWSYNGGEGIPGTILSLLDLKDRQPDLILPSHGEPMTEAAIDPTVERLANLRTLRRQNPRLFLLRETPYEAITPHVLKNRTSMANCYVLVSESGKAMCIDFGYDFLYGLPYGQDRASRRPWLYTLPKLKQEYGVSSIDVVLPTHFHDDHVAGINLLRAVEKTQVWAPDLFADVLEHPAAYDLPCLWYDPIPVDERLPLETPIAWEEYQITLYPLSGHTYYAVAILVEADGKRILFTGDQWADSDGLGLNYVYKNGFRPQDYRETAELVSRIKPDLLITGHWEPITVTDEYLEKLVERGTELERFHHDLQPALPSVEIRPYQVTAQAGRPFTVEVLAPEGAEMQLVAPAGWKIEGFTVTPPDQPVRRARIAADVTISGQRYGQLAEALVTVHQGDE